MGASGCRSASWSRVGCCSRSSILGGTGVAAPGSIGVAALVPGLKAVEEIGVALLEKHQSLEDVANLVDQKASSIELVAVGQFAKVKTVACHILRQPRVACHILRQH